MLKTIKITLKIKNSPGQNLGNGHPIINHLPGVLPEQNAKMAFIIVSKRSKVGSCRALKAYFC